MKLKNVMNRICLGVLWWVLATSCLHAENIDPDLTGSQYAWGENIGWLNARPLGENGPGLTVTSTRITGYLYAENIGWISMSCQNRRTCDKVMYGAENDGNGVLSGYVWGENVGWISLSCKNTGSCQSVNYGVSIDPATGQFTGYAWGENIGWITFDSARLFNAGIVTSWTSTSCLADSEPDGDVDGIDLAHYAATYAQPEHMPIEEFAPEFGTVCGD